MQTGKVAEEELQWLTFEKFPIWEACGADKKVLRELAGLTSGPLSDPDGRSGWATVFSHEGDRQMEKARSPALE